MKRIIALLAVVATGCSTSYIESAGVKAHNTRWFWSSTDFKASLDTNGVMSVELKSSSSDQASLAAVAEGVAKGMVAGAKP